MLPEYLKVTDNKGKEWKLRFSLEKQTDQIEIWRFSIGDKSFALRNDRPLIKAQDSKRKPKWQLIEGRIKDARFMANILDELKKVLKNEETGGFEAQLEYTRTKKLH